MIGRLIIGIIILIVISLTTYIVWTNRSSEKILTNFTTALVVGVIGLLATSIVSLKEEKLVDTYPACIFIQKTPLFLMNYAYNFNNQRITPIITTNNSIQYLLITDANYCNSIFPLDSPEKWKNIQDLFVRYVVDLLQSRFATTWYLRSYEFRAPGGFVGSTWPLENMSKEYFNTNKFESSFRDNKFIKTGQFKDIQNKDNDIEYMIYFPEKTKINYHTDSLSNGIIEIDNPFVNLRIKFRCTVFGQSVDSKILKAFQIQTSNLDNYMFIPFLIESNTKFKKYKYGAPMMEKYKYWVNDLLSYIKLNISINEFWNQIDNNQ